MSYRPQWAPDEVEIERPSAARMYDYYLGGSHNFEADRDLARVAVSHWPDLPLVMRANRAFLRRAVRFLVAQGVTQFLDLGSGIPTVGNVHEVAASADPACRVVYVDIDPVAVAHSRRLLEGVESAAIVHADARDAETVLSAPATRSLLDFSKPVAVMMVALLHFVSDADGPAAVVARYRDAVAPGSLLALSHATVDGVGEVMRDHERIYQRSATPIHARTRAQVHALFDGFELVEPGVSYLPLWRPDPGEPPVDHPERYSGYAAVGRKV
ncbi:SAM-dependent methyltransferase [Actinocrinis puniceicyclus]|uniref:SAM-dependent methyltransferase n=1 Tax=Actinocrinis puniceicyclus TaxID=977794 RepID=A0A8J7WTD6_9ACTN|nr:SAM-dependent methyltransferase [Actinocrinis puniceicyclus]MBS2964849.1 SAM-dependent methyltransferase [Actinocrinis puniceicyclus]